jgi:hypothetical protein
LEPLGVSTTGVPGCMAVLLAAALTTQPGG